MAYAHGRALHVERSRKMPPTKITPLTPGERARLHALVSANDPELAERAAEELDGDPVARAVAQLTADITGEMRQMRTQVLWVIVIIVGLGMVLQAGMVGVGLSYSGNGHAFSTQPASHPSVQPVPWDMPRTPDNLLPAPAALPPPKASPTFEDVDDTDAVGLLTDTL